MKKSASPQVTVWDTYVTKRDGATMHFDIIAPTEVSDPQTIYGYGRDYLQQKGQAGQALAAEQWRRCHIEYLQPRWEQDIAQQGYAIIEIEGC